MDNICWGRNALLTSCCLSWVYGSLPELPVNTCRSDLNKGHGGDQRWRTFLQNHANAMVACDFCVVVTATFRLLYVLIVIEHGSRRLLHCNVTEHPTTEWTRQQFREAIPSESPIPLSDS